MQFESWLRRMVIRWIGAVVVAVAAVVVVIVLLGPITDLIARHDVGALPVLQRAAYLQAARETARTQLLTLGAGLFAAGALVFTARNFGLSREGQLTDRYTKAIEQLGSDKLDVRLGGIYALERVARDSSRDQPTVMEVLCAFIHEHSHEQWPPDPGRKHKQMTRPDVQAAVTVVGRRIAERDIRQMDLSVLATRVPASDSCHLLVRAGSVKVVFACTFTRQLDGCGCPAVTDGLDGF